MLPVISMYVVGTQVNTVNPISQGILNFNSSFNMSAINLFVDNKCDLFIFFFQELLITKVNSVIAIPKYIYQEFGNC